MARDPRHVARLCSSDRPPRPAQEPTDVRSTHPPPPRPSPGGAPAPSGGARPRIGAAGRAPAQPRRPGSRVRPRRRPGGLGHRRRERGSWWRQQLHRPGPQLLAPQRHPGGRRPGGAHGLAQRVRRAHEHVGHAGPAGGQLPRAVVDARLAPLRLREPRLHPAGRGPGEQPRRRPAQPRRGAGHRPGVRRQWRGPLRLRRHVRAGRRGHGPRPGRARRHRHRR